MKRRRANHQLLLRGATLKKFPEQRIERKRARARNENNHDREEEEELVRRDKLVGLAQDHAHAIDIRGQVSDREQDEQRNGNQARGQTDEQEQTAEAFPTGGEDGLRMRPRNPEAFEVYWVGFDRSMSFPCR